MPTVSDFSFGVSVYVTVLGIAWNQVILYFVRGPLGTVIFRSVKVVKVFLFGGLF